MEHILINDIKNIGRLTKDDLVAKIVTMNIATSDLVTISKLFARASKLAKNAKTIVGPFAPGLPVKLDSTIDTILRSSKSLASDGFITNTIVAMKLPIRDIWEAEKILDFAADVTDMAIAAILSGPPKPLVQSKPLTKPSTTLLTKPSTKPEPSTTPKSSITPKPSTKLLVPVQPIAKMLDFHSKINLTLPNKKYLFIEAIQMAHDDNKYDPSFEQALREVKSGHKVSCWSWYVFPALAVIRPKTERPEFLITDFGAACHLIMQPRFYCNYIIMCIAINQQVTSGVQLNDLLSERDADKFRESLYLFSLATQFISRTVYPAKNEIARSVVPILLKTLITINYTFHQKTFDIAQEYINRC